MRYAYSHITRYDYSGPVFLETHAIRLRPRLDGGQRPLRFDMAIEPEPAGMTHTLDAWGNLVTQAWFHGLTESLRITTEGEVETSRENAFDFILEPEATELPFRYDSHEAPALRPYLQPTEPASNGHDNFGDFVRRTLEDTGRQTLPFLTELTHRLYERTAVIVRETGEPWPPRRTFDEATGSCRDLAVLFMEVCRSIGLASRFVSGYQEGDPDTEQRELHAWASVYLPLAGWRGFDPTHGLAVTDRHIALATGPEPPMAAPLSGSYRGTGVEASLSHRIELHEVDSDTPSYFNNAQ